MHPYILTSTKQCFAILPYTGTLEPGLLDVYKGQNRRILFYYYYYFLYFLFKLTAVQKTIVTVSKTDYNRATNTVQATLDTQCAQRF